MRRVKSWIATLLAIVMIIGMFPAGLAADERGTVSITQETVNAEKNIYKLVIKAQASGIYVSGAAFTLSFDNTVIQPVKAADPYDVIDGIVDNSTNADAFPMMVGTDFMRTGAKWAVENNRSAFAISVMSPAYGTGTSIDTEKTVTEFYYTIKEGQSAAKGTFRIETPDVKGSLLSELFGPENEQNALYIGAQSGAADNLYYGTKVMEENLSASLTYDGMSIQKLGSLSLDAVDAVEVSKDNQTTKAPTVTALDTEGDPMTSAPSVS